MDLKKKLALKRIIDGRAMKERHRNFRVVAGLTRYRILALLKVYDAPLNVTDIAEILDGSTSSISHELIILRKRGFVNASTKGREVYYRVNGLMEKLFPTP